MGDISAEPSMEDILSSIKRIIAEENDPVPGRPRRPARPAATTTEARSFDRDEVLELNEPAPEPPRAPEPAYEPEPLPTFASAPVQASARVVAAAPTAAAPEAILSQRTADASRGPLDALSRLVVKPDVAGADTLEGMVREMLRPMLKDWLDSHLPTMVEAMVAREIDRITGK